ncbi:MAG: hypothetical protein PWQ69_1019 [Methanomicrobiaceae archaeon]|nr:hypothetical protein [Methanomicrobiaceae archaeon]
MLRNHRNGKNRPDARNFGCSGGLTRQPHPFVVNYPALQGGASCFMANTCTTEM